MPLGIAVCSTRYPSRDRAMLPRSPPGRCTVQRLPTRRTLEESPAASQRLQLALLLTVAIGLGGCQSTAPVTDWRLRQRPEVTTATFDASGKPTSGQALGAQVWGLGLSAATSWEAHPAGESEVLAQDPESRPQTRPSGGEAVQDQDQERQRAASIRARFGSNVIVKSDGKLTKSYMLGGETGAVFLQLISEPVPVGDPTKTAAPPTGLQRIGGRQPSRSVLAQMLGEHEIEMIFFKDFEKTPGTRIGDRVFGTAPVPAGPVGEIVNSMVLVTADVGGMVAFEDALNLFFGFAPQVEIEVKVVEYSTASSLNFGVIPINSTTPVFNNSNSKALIRSINSSFPLSAPLIAGASLTDRGTFSLGGIHDSWALNAQLEMLEANAIADIISRPKMVVRNGGLATVTTKISYPYPEAKITSSGQNVSTNIVFKDVGITMNIRPLIAGTETVIVEVSAEFSLVTEFADTGEVDTPIVANRSAITSVHVPNRKTAVIGGLRSQSKLDSENKIPLLGDIPIVGYLFRATSTTTQETTLEFHITPRIIEGPSEMASTR